MPLPDETGPHDAAFGRAMGGKTVTRWLTEEQARYQEWIAARYRARETLAEIEEVSRLAEILLQTPQHEMLDRLPEVGPQQRQQPSPHFSRASS
jgi:hypothetical protein